MEADKDLRRKIDIKDFYARNISFKKDKEPGNRAEVDAKMTCQYHWTNIDSNKAMIEASVDFEFIPRILFTGKVKFIINIEVNEDVGLEDEEARKSILDIINPRLTSATSFLATVCGEEISKSKFIIPPFFSDVKQI